MECKFLYSTYNCNLQIFKHNMAFARINWATYNIVKNNTTSSTKTLFPCL